MYQDAKKFAAKKSYSSISEFIRTALREKLYEEQGLTVNGFTPEFEDEVLKIAATSSDNDEIWEKEEDIRNYFKKLRRNLTKKN